MTPAGSGKSHRLPVPGSPAWYIVATEGRLAQLRDGGKDPVPSAHAHLHEDDEMGTDLAADERPILLADIDQVLAESAVLERTRGASPIRVWRDELTLALESLAYARAILAADVSILRHSLVADGSDPQDVVDDLPTVMNEHPWGDGWSESEEEDDLERLDLAVFARSDRLVAAHEQMAHVDLSSTEDVERVLRELEAQLSELTGRQQAVQIRLQQIRAAIVRQYQEGAVRTRDWLG
jgi:hypothetical protein